MTAYHHEIKALYAAGCRYLQIDETSLVKLGDPRARQLLKERGDDWQDLLRVYVDAVNAVVAGAPADMQIAIHVCRSQETRAGKPMSATTPIADALFNRMNVRHVSSRIRQSARRQFRAVAAAAAKASGVVLGLIAARNPVMETVDGLKRRIEEAARFAPLDQLARFAPIAALLPA